MGVMASAFEGMTSEQLADWVKHGLPALAAQQDRSHTLARRQSLEMIGRPIRRAARTEKEEKTSE
jgi:hypothetical protein